MLNSDIPSAPRNKVFQRLISIHKTVAFVILNTLILFGLFNIAFYIIYSMVDWKKAENPFAAHPEEWQDAAYPGWKPEDRSVLYNESYGHELVFDDYVMFKNGPLQGRYVNISDVGFRVSKNQGPWPPDPNNYTVFVFGGSTMLGSGVTDEETVSSGLQDALSRHIDKRVCVYNFGTSFYYSTQERILLERLLSKGYTPDAAIFVDGLNDFIQSEDTSAHRQKFKDAFEIEKGNKELLAAMFTKLPIWRPVNSIQARLQPPAIPDATDHADKATQTIGTYLSNKSLIESVCKAKGVTPIFVWQPVPIYNYDLEYFPWYKQFSMHQLHPVGYPMMRELVDNGGLGENFLWCADLQQDEKECLYVDFHHYTASFSMKLADTICQMAMERELLMPDQAQPQK